MGRLRKPIPRDLDVENKVVGNQTNDNITKSGFNLRRYKRMQEGKIVGCIECSCPVLGGRRRLVVPGKVYEVDKRRLEGFG